MDRYRRWDGESWCVQCGAVVVAGATPLHDAFHDRIDRLEVTVKALTIEVPLEATATDWQAAHDAGEDEEMRVGTPLCHNCGHHEHLHGYDGARYDHCKCHGCDCPGCDDGDPAKDAAPHADPCDCDDCRPPRTLHRQPDAPTDEPPVGAVARCFGCGNVYVRKADGWVNTDDGSRELAWVGIARSFCGPVKVIYNPEEDK